MLSNHKNWGICRYCPDFQFPIINKSVPGIIYNRSFSYINMLHNCPVYYYSVAFYQLFIIWPPSLLPPFLIKYMFVRHFRFVSFYRRGMELVYKCGKCVCGFVYDLPPSNHRKPTITHTNSIHKRTSATELLFLKFVYSKIGSTSTVAWYTTSVKNIRGKRGSDT